MPVFKLKNKLKTKLQWNFLLRWRNAEIYQNKGL